MSGSASARFALRARSRQPRIGVDYVPRPGGPRYTSAYLNPTSYVISVDAFPGVIVEPAGDQQARPGERPQDRWMLRVPPDTTGFEFRLTGQPDRRFPVGPLPRKVTEIFRAKLPRTHGTGTFSAKGPGPWLHDFTVPGPGRYEVTVSTTSAVGVYGSRTGQLTLRDLTIVSIGDSAASGEGNPDKPGRPKGFDPDFGWFDLIPPVAAYTLASALYDKMKNVVKKELTTLSRAFGFTLDMDPKPVWLEEHAHRSLASGHARAARIIEQERPGTVVTFLPFGRSGAKINEGLINDSRGSADKYIGHMTEIDEVVANIGKRRIDVLLIYIGINDIGITSTLNDLTKGDGIVWLPFAPFGDDGAHRSAALRATNEAVDDHFPKSFGDLADAIHAKLHVRHVYLCEYPTGLFDDPFAQPAAGCGLFESDFDLDVSKADAKAIQDMAEKLNDGVKKAAAANHWFYVTNIANRFRGKGYYTDFWVNRAFVQAEESLGLQGDTEGTVHPNGRGHQIIGEEVAAMVLKNTADKPEGNMAGNTGPLKTKAT